MPKTTDLRRQYELLRVACDEDMMFLLHGVENIGYAFDKASIAEFNKNYYSIMLKGKNHDIVVQQVGRIIQGLGFERSLPPPPTQVRAEFLQRNVHAFNEAVEAIVDILIKAIDAVKDFEVEIHEPKFKQVICLGDKRFVISTSLSEETGSSATSATSI